MHDDDQISEKDRPSLHDLSVSTRILEELFEAVPRTIGGGDVSHENTSLVEHHKLATQGSRSEHVDQGSQIAELRHLACEHSHEMPGSDPHPFERLVLHDPSSRRAENNGDHR